MKNKIKKLVTVSILSTTMMNVASANNLIAIVLQTDQTKYKILELNDNTEVPEEIEYLSEDSPNLIKMYSFSSYNFALDSDGAIWVGNSFDDWSKSSLDGVSDLSVSFNHALAIKDDELYVFGENENGQFGNGSTNDSNMWLSTGITGVDDIAAVSDSFRGMSFILRNGEVYSAGSDFLGRLHSPASESCLGLPCSTSFNKTTLPASNIIKLIPGARSLIAQSSDGKTYISSHTGWFEDPTIGLTDLTYSAYDAFAFKGNTLYSYGVNGAGQLDTGDRVEKTSFSATSLSNVKEASMFMSGISDGSSIGGAYALTNDGLLYSIGHNYYSELGIGTKTNYETSWQLTEEKDIVSLMNSGEKVYFKKTDGNYYYMTNEKVDGSYLSRVSFRIPLPEEEEGEDSFEFYRDAELPIVPAIENFSGYINHPKMSESIIARKNDLGIVLLNLSDLDPSSVIQYYDNGGKDASHVNEEELRMLVLQPPLGYNVSINIDKSKLNPLFLKISHGYSDSEEADDVYCDFINPMPCVLTSNTENGSVSILPIYKFDPSEAVPSDFGWEGTITFVPK